MYKTQPEKMFEVYANQMVNPFVNEHGLYQTRRAR